MNDILRKLSTQVANVRIRDMLMVQIHLCWQRLITRPSNKVFDFVWHPELPQALPELLMVFGT